MRRSLNLFPAALLCIVAAFGGRASAEPQQVIVHNGGAEDVVVTITDLNTGNALIANQQGLFADSDMPIKATLDSNGVYHLHWKVQDMDRTKTEEGDCIGAPVFTCPVDLLAAP
jgi:hypothetical protein